MATLVLGLAGKWIGGPLLGALGTIAGRVIDQTLFSPTVRREGPRLSDLTFSASSEGSPMPRVYGRMRVSTQVIWATRYREEKKTTKSGGKGGPKVKTTEYSYSVSFAVGLCEGPIAGVGRVWADGKLIRLSNYTHRVYPGDEEQQPDPLISALEGAARTPAFRGTAYIVFEDLPLEEFGNRAPQITVEVIRRPPGVEPRLEELLRAVTLIPGTTEFGYATTPVFVGANPEAASGLDQTTADNANVASDATDFVVALDQLQEQAPSVGHVSLVVAWHGTDLRCGSCEIRPKVERADRHSRPFSWRVGPVTRETAMIVSQFGGNPAAGGAPCDRSVFEAIVELKARGLGVTLYPFILMDIAAGNGLPDPYGGGEQAAYPWRGRVTCHPAPGEPGTVDKTGAAAGQVASFFGTAAAGDFGWNATEKHVTYSGPDEWSFRRHILHLARLAAAAGGVDMFLIGSEMVGLTTIRSDASTYPAVAQLVALAGEVRQIVGAETLVSYAADWSEYHSHRPADGSGDVFFHLDPLWADANIDFVGIDNYLPIADWRDGSGHLDDLAGASSAYDLDYLRSNVEGGEYFDWYYADQSARAAQARAPIVDGAEGKHWVFRQKDIRNWWLEEHFDRPTGAEAATPTAWLPQSKPIVFTELGCPAVDKGANQPNVFVDPKSSESLLPHHSNGRRDDLMQRAFLEAVLSYWAPSAGNNPVSGVYAGHMVDWERTHLWTWDARPHPEFPALSGIWADASNWTLGHWLTGRLGAVRLADAVLDIAGGFGVPLDVSALSGLLTGYHFDQVASARDMLNPLATAYFFDGCETGEAITFRHRGGEPVATFARDGLARRDGGADFSLTRAQESELPRGIDLRFYLSEADYRQGTVRSRRLAGEARMIAQEGFPIVLSQARAAAVADTLLFQAHAERDAAEFSLPPSALGLGAGDVVTLEVAAGAGTRFLPLRIGEIGTGLARAVRAAREEAQVYDQDDGADTALIVPRPKQAPPPVLHFLDLPLLADGEEATAHAPKLAAWSLPWLPVDVYRGAAPDVSPSLDTIVSEPAGLGELAETLWSGPLWRWDRVNALTVRMADGETLSSASEIEVMGGANLAAVQTPAGRWEVVQWRDAELVAPKTWRLTHLLRGQRGSDADMAAAVAPGAAFVVLDGSLAESALPAELARSEQHWTWGPSNRTPSDTLFQSATRDFEAIGLRPLSPVHLKAIWNADGDIQISWTRRTRIGGDDWEKAEVPLGEDQEAYEVEILSADGSLVLRTVSGLGAPAWLYPVALQTADLGAPAASIRYRVFQVSAAIGRGAPAGYP